ncbi:MAG: hypothetical protein Q9226_008860, partial [Calogaya cf. arnoldii]
ALPIDFTYGAIPNWYWRLFEVQLGIIAACNPALSPGYKWSQSKMRAYISSHTKSSNTYTSKQKPPVRQIGEEKTARHLRAHPANVYSDPPMMLQRGNTWSSENGKLGMTGKAYVQDSITIDVKSQRVMGSLKGLDQEAEESRAWHRPSLEGRSKFGTDISGSIQHNQSFGTASKKLREVGRTGHAQTPITMDDARSDKVASPPDDQAPDAIGSPPSTPPNFGKDIPDNTQVLLQRMAQDASSQAQDAAPLPAHRQEEELPSNTISHEPLVNGDVITHDGSGPSVNGIPFGILNESNVMPTGIETQDSHIPWHNFSDHALPEGLTQANIDSLAYNLNIEVATSLLDGESEPPRVAAFAKLEFDDGEFYMNTYSVELGRDVRAARHASENHFQTLQRASGSSRNLSSSGGDASRASSKKVKRENGYRLTGSIVSESGGVIAFDHSDSEAPRRRRAKKSKSTSSSSQQLSRKSSMNFPGLLTDYQSLALASLSDPLPSPDFCPLVPIHPPTLNDGITINHKSISRKHVKIAFNFEKHLFEVTVMGRNGAFVDEEWYPAGHTQPLRSGSLIQVGGVGIRFLLPDVALGETGAKNNLRSDPASFESDNEDGVSGNDEYSSGPESGDQDEDEEESRDDSDGDGSNDSDEENRSESISEEEKRGRPGAPKPTLANRPVRSRKP